jgi:hypothetical protein
MGDATTVAATGAALALLAFGVVGVAMRPRPAQPRLVSMSEAAQAMMLDGGAMQTHGQARRRTTLAVEASAG